MSNTWRGTLTALSLSTLWVASFGFYSIAREEGRRGGMPLWPESWTLRMWEAIRDGEVWAHSLWISGQLLCGLLTALVALALLSLARHAAPFKLRDRRILFVGLLFTASIWTSYWIGRLDYQGVRHWQVTPSVATAIVLCWPTWKSKPDTAASDDQ